MNSELIKQSEMLESMWNTDKGLTASVFRNWTSNMHYLKKLTEGLRLIFDHKSTIDHIVTNRNIQPTKILHVRKINSTNVCSYHSLLLNKLRMAIRINKTLEKVQKTNIKLFWKPSGILSKKNR